MRLLVVSSWLPYPPDNGSRLRAFHLLQHLAKRHSISLLAFQRSGERAAVGPLADMCRRVCLVPDEAAPKAPLAMNGLFSPVPRYHVQHESRAMRQQIRAGLSEHDLVLALQLRAAFHVAGEERALPTVFDEMEAGGTRDDYRRAGTWAIRLRGAATWWKFRYFARRLIARFDWTTVVSEVERRHLEDIGCDPSRIAVVPNGVEVPAATGAGRRVDRLIYPGSVTYSANLDAVRYFVDEVLPLVRRVRPRLQFWVTGATDGVELGTLPRVEGVTFTGRVADVAPLVGESLACVVPLRHGGGTRLKVLEAMALGTPVVSTSKGIEGLDVRPGHDVLVADTAHAFRDQIVRLAGDPALGRRLASNARQLVEGRYRWATVGDSLERVLRRAVSARRP